MIKLVIFGLSGSGKSTIAKLVKTYFEDRGKKVLTVKIAQPLYEIQNHIYNKLQLPVSEGTQDQIILESIAANIRRISQTYLVDSFLDKVRRSEADVVINDDLRDFHTDYPRLVESGFTFIKVTCKEEVRQMRLHNRNDLTIVQNSSTTKNIQDFNYQIHIDNSNLSLQQLQSFIYEILEDLK